MIAAACIVFALALLAYVFNVDTAVLSGEQKSRLAFLCERKETVYENLRDLNFELKAGKISPADYDSLCASLEDEAAAILAEIDELERHALTA